MKKMTTGILIAAMLIFNVALLSAQRRGGYGPHHRRGPGNHRRGGWFWNREILDRLGVSREKRDEIRLIVDKLRAKALQYQTEVREKRIQIRREYFRESLNEEKIRKIMGEIAEIRKEQQYQVDLHKLEMMKRLTADQRKHLYRLLRERKRRFWRHMRKNYR